ncbi:MAG TPA: hypothetical protein VLQ68_08000 [Rhizobiaceae bacterium]|nr:hypothetical protein [Rhizobiaceae bacterium]
MLLDLAQDDFIVAMAFVCTTSFICGWLADRIMGFAGFGVIGNWLLLFAGSCAALYGLDWYGVRMIYAPILTIATGFGGAAAMLLAMASFKAATHT